MKPKLCPDGALFGIVVPLARFINVTKDYMKSKHNANQTIIASEQTNASETGLNTASTTLPKQNTSTTRSCTLLRLPQVLARFPVARSTWYAGVSAGVYPKPVSISTRAVAWTQDSIDALIKGRDNDTPR